MMKALVFRFIWALGLLAVATVSAQAQEVAPTFKDERGVEQRFDDYLGQDQFLVVKVWASHCGVCKASMSDLVAFQRDFGDRVKVLGIAVDGVQSRAAVDQFIAQYKVNFPTLMDDGSRAAQLYLQFVQEPWVGGTPTYLVFDRSGKIIGQNYGPLTHAKLKRFINAQGGQLS